jgi:hypothetical protein
MIVLAGLVLGAVWGGQTARRRGGNRLDIAQYATVWGIIGALVGLFVTIALERML